MEKLLSEPSSWKGRAQTILLLKKKLEEYSIQGNYAVKEKDVHAELKRDKIDQVLQELEGVKESLVEQTRKSSTLKARNKVLELEISRLKGKLSTLLLKIEKDDDYIQALQKISQGSTPTSLEKQILEKVLMFL